MTKREIKFRAFTTNGDLVYGNLAIIKKHSPFNNVEPGTYISNSTGSPFAYLVRPETVEQYTGLKDSKNVEIYEGDIIRSFYEFHRTGGSGEYRDSEVIYSEDGEWILKQHDYSISDYFVCGKSDELEVIGNKHENPELL